MNPDTAAGEMPAEKAFPDDDDDKKFVSQAVAFVIGHARNGFVSLCASVATLLKDQAKFKEEIEKLSHEIARLRQESSSVKFICQEKSPKTDLKSHKTLDFVLKEQTSRQSLPVYQTKLKNNLLNPSNIPYTALRGCICHKCLESEKEQMLNCPIQKGTKVIVLGELFGTVCYAGHVDELIFPEIYVGLQLSEAAGDTDGTLTKSYFFTAKNYGIFIPLTHVRCMVK